MKISLCSLPATTYISLKLNGPTIVKATVPLLWSFCTFCQRLPCQASSSPASRKHRGPAVRGNPDGPIYKYASPSLPISMSLTLWLTIEIRLGRQQFSEQVMVDSCSYRNSIDHSVVLREKLPMHNNIFSLTLETIDGCPLINGAITKAHHLLKLKLETTLKSSSLTLFIHHGTL